VLDVGGGDDCKDTSAVAGAGEVDQGDLPRVECVAEGSAQVLRSDATEFRYERKQQPFRMGVFRRASLTLLEGNRRPNLTPVFVLMVCPFLRNGWAGDEVVDTIARIRRAFHIQGKPIKRIAASCMCRGTRCARCCARETAFSYERNISRSRRSALALAAGRLLMANSASRRASG
jgi:hypothetical protein